MDDPSHHEQFHNLLFWPLATPILIVFKKPIPLSIFGSFLAFPLTHLFLCPDAFAGGPKARLPSAIPPPVFILCVPSLIFHIHRQRELYVYPLDPYPSLPYKGTAHRSRNKEKPLL
jgi:hypothetical protein